MKVLLKHITELDFLLFSAKSYYLSSSAMSNLYQIVSWNLLKFISTTSEYSNISLVLLVFKLTSWFNSISLEPEINLSLQKLSTTLGGRMNTDESRDIRGVSCYQIAPGFISLNAAMTPLVHNQGNGELSSEFRKRLSVWWSFQQRGRLTAHHSDLEEPILSTRRSWFFHTFPHCLQIHDF